MVLSSAAYMRTRSERSTARNWAWILARPISRSASSVPDVAGPAAGEHVETDRTLLAAGLVGGLGTGGLQQANALLEPLDQHGIA